jgi:prepilin-type N-terminal cleavage/methylation domain-containing protein
MKRGFTLIEIVVVMAIIAIGTLLVLPDTTNYINDSQLISCYSAEKSAITEIRFNLAYDKDGDFAKILKAYCDESVASVENTQKLFGEISTSRYIHDCPTGGNHTVIYDDLNDSIEVRCDTHGTVIDGAIISFSDDNSDNDSQDNNTEDEGSIDNNDNEEEPIVDDQAEMILSKKTPYDSSRYAAYLLNENKDDLQTIFNNKTGFIKVKNSGKLKDFFDQYVPKKDKIKYKSSYVELVDDIIIFCYVSNKTYYYSFVEDSTVKTYVFKDLKVKAGKEISIYKIKNFVN